MPLPEHVQEQRNALVEKVIKDIEAGKPFFGILSTLADQRLIWRLVHPIMGLTVCD